MTLGIVGGGQLARMLILAGARLGLRFKVYDPSPEACAGQLASLTCGAFADANALMAFARDLDVLTFDFENVPASTLAALENQINIAPNPRALAMTQDRLSEKRAFTELNIPVAPYAAVATADELFAAIERLGTPGILKTRTLGYDGKGQARILHPEAALHTWENLALAACVYESIVSFKRELSIVAVRAKSGEFCAYPLVQNIHADGILAVSIAPAPQAEALSQLATQYAKQVAEAFDYVGTFALEFFELGAFELNSALVLNEMAPRVHNSGHWSIEGAECSQFENHVRAIAGLPLGSTNVRQPSVMLNWIGAMPALEPHLQVPGLAWHDYGKSAREGRKVGHATLCAPDFAQLRARLQRLSEVCDTPSLQLALAADW